MTSHQNMFQMPASKIPASHQLITSSGTYQARVDSDVAKVEELVKALREVPTTTPSTAKATLSAIYDLISSKSDDQEPATLTAFIKAGLLAATIDVLIGSESRSVCERAMLVMDAICSFEHGREAARGHALTVPVLVKKMFRVSDLATEVAVSALWKLCKRPTSDEREGACMECMQVGAFQKVLLFLQVGYSEKTRRQAGELLKVLNVYRSRGEECIETMDFKHLRRSF